MGYNFVPMQPPVHREFYLLLSLLLLYMQWGTIAALIKHALRVSRRERERYWIIILFVYRIVIAQTFRIAII